MVCKRFCLLVVLLTLQFVVNAQEWPDTVKLNEVSVFGSRWEKYAAGTKTIKFDSLSLSQNRYATLSDLLLQKTPVYIKEYGNGMASSISFRGTSSSHTAIIWNGININSATLGSTDLSLIPIFTADQIEIQHGSSGSMFGTDAIGGSIQYNNLPSWRKGILLELNQTAGSFGRYFTGIRSEVSTGRVSYKTNIYRFSSENDFSFTNRVKYGKPVEKQENASYEYKGLMQELYIKTNSTDYISLIGWFHTNDREIQPIMSENLAEKEKYETQLDESLRLMGGYVKTLNNAILTTKAGMVRDYLNYNEQSEITVTRTLALTEYDWDVNSFLQVKSGINWQYFYTNVDDYDQNVDEHRNDIYFSANVTPIQKLNISLNARQPFFSNRKAPFTPSLGVSYKALEDHSGTITIKGMAAKGYRVPTFNDRFWSQSGNPDLLPENSLSAETGVSYSKDAELIQAEFEATVYRMWVNDWIQWVPDGGPLWKPQNVKEVHVKGAEIFTSVTFKQPVWNFKVTANYGYTASENNKEPLKGKQLIYVPLHKGTFTMLADYAGWFMQVNSHYTGARYTSEDNTIKSRLPSYFLNNLSLGKNISKGRSLKCSASVSVNNLFDTAYENIELRAMPGRNYQLSLRINYLH